LSLETESRKSTIPVAATRNIKNAESISVNRLLVIGLKTVKFRLLSTATLKKRHGITASLDYAKSTDREHAGNTLIT
jgi:hypothetical protein